MSRTIRDRQREQEDSRTCFRYPRRWQEWQRLLAVAPHLKAMLPSAVNEMPPPYPTADKAFLALAACFADPSKREALRALIFDLMYDDLKELFIRHCERMHGWPQQQAKQAR